MCFFVYDCETTGLMRTRQPASLYNTMLFDSSRLISICWIILNENHEEIKRIVKTIIPTGFTIPEEATAIHGITTEMAYEQGVAFEDIFEELQIDLESCDTIVSHNIAFDLNILASELYRRADENPKFKEQADDLLAKARYCTMKYGHLHLKLKKWPTLRDLYSLLMQKEIANLHDALFDTLNCADCYRKLSVFNV